MATNREWSIAYARQAKADFSMFQTLMSVASLEPTVEVEECHKLQFLQMACEKLVKAHLCGQDNNPSDLQTSHAFVARTLPIVLRETAETMGLTGRHAKELMLQTRHLAREIELLAPAVKRGGLRPDNCEYPWEDELGELHVPLDWSFPTSNLLAVAVGRTFLKLIRVAIDSLIA